MLGFWDQDPAGCSSYRLSAAPILSDLGSFLNVNLLFPSSRRGYISDGWSVETTNERPELKISWSGLWGRWGLFFSGQPFIPSQGSFILSQGCVVRNISNDDSNTQWGVREMLERSFICPLYVFARPYSLTLRAGVARWSHKTHLTQLRGHSHPTPPPPSHTLVHQHRTSSQRSCSHSCTPDISNSVTA